MKFKDISERVKDGKLDPLSRMGKSKLTGQEVATYYRQNPKAKQAAKDPLIKKAIELALDLGGNYTLAYKEIQKLNRNLPRHPEVKKALQTANESVNEGVSVSDERIVNKGKGIIIMIDDNGKKVSAIFKDKKNADKFNRNKPSDVKKLLKLAKSKKYPKAIDENEMTSTSSVAMPEIPLGKVKKRKDLEESMEDKLGKLFKTRNRKEIDGIANLMNMTSVKVLQSMQKQNPKGFSRMAIKMGELPAMKESINEETLLYRIRDIQKPELDKFKSSARLMKLKINIKQSPMKKETLIRLQGSKKQINDFDAVVRGKSSYGDPSVVEDAVERAKELADLKAKHKREVEQEKDEIERTKQSASAESVLAQLDALEEQVDLLEKQYAIKPDMDWTAPATPKYRGKHSKAKKSYGVDKEDVVAMIRKKKDGKHKIKDGNTSLIVRSLARMMNQDRKGARDKGAAFGKGEPKDEMNAPEIKKMIDIVSKGIEVTKRGDKIFRKASEVNAFTNVDTAVRDDVYKVLNMASDGTLSSLVYNESTELNEESAVMKKVRQVVKKKSMMNIDGMKLDLTTASMIASVYDQVNPQNKKRMDKLKLPQLINLTMKVARGKSRKESTDLQEVTRQEVDAMKKVSKDMQKVLQTYQKIATIGDKELRDTRHNKDYKKVLDARDSILKMIGTLNTKMLMQKEAVSPKQQAMLRRVKERFPRLSQSEQEKIAMIVKPKGQIDSKLFVDLGNAYDKRDLKTLKKLMTNYGKKYKIEAVSPAQQAAIAISKKERGEKPKNECADEKDFKPHKMYKGDKEVMANTYADHVKYDKMGYTHEKPKAEALDAKDKPFVKDLVKKLRGGSKTHAKQADDLEKALNTESMSRARADAMRDMGKPTDRGDDDGYGVATKDDRKAADKNVVMQIRRVTDLSKPAQIELRNGKKVMLKPADAKMMMKKFDAIRKPQDRLKVQTAMNDKKMTVQGLKRLLGR